MKSYPHDIKISVLLINGKTVSRWQSAQLEREGYTPSEIRVTQQFQADLKAGKVSTEVKWPCLREPEIEQSS